MGEANNITPSAGKAVALPASDLFERQVLRKVTLRLLPFLCLLYGFNILDRNNVGFASLTMLSDRNISEDAYSLGAGIFFIGYFVFQLPSNLSLTRIGARRWISCIMVSWGLISTCMMFVQGPASFAVLRFVLGLAEGGFYPGILLYLTFWFPTKHRARVVSRFMIASPLVGIIGGPISGAVMQYMNNFGGLAGWQWLFLIEGLPAVVLGVIVLAYLSDRPDKAGWLSEEERSRLSAKIAEEHVQREKEHGLNLKQVLISRRVWHLILLYTAIAGGIAGLSAYLPKLIEARFPGRDKFEIGLLSAVPSIGAIIGMMLVGSHSDRTGERRWHVAVPASVAAIGWLLYTITDSPTVSLLSLTLAQMGMISVMGPFWSMPTVFLGGRSAAAGIALINAFGNLGGFVAPLIIGKLRISGNDYTVGLIVMSCTLISAAILAISVKKQ